MSRVLESSEINRQLVDHQRWKVDDSLSAQFDFNSFEDAIRFVDALAVEASDMDHHPDIDIRYDTVVLNVVTHSEGGITQLDVELAIRADRIFEGMASNGA